METKPTSSRRELLIGLLTISLIINLAGAAFITVLYTRLNNEITLVKSNQQATIQQYQKTTDQFINTVGQQIQNINAKIDSFNSNLTELKTSLDTVNSKVGELQKQEASNTATIGNLQTLTSQLMRQQQYPYYPYSYSYPYPIYSPSGILATIQFSSNVLTLSSTYVEGLRAYYVYTLTGYITALVTNTSSYDANSAILTVDFQFQGIPNLPSSTIQLSGGSLSWVNTVLTNTNLRFQTVQWGTNIPAGQTLTIPLTLTISNFNNFGGVQSYPFSVTASTNQ